MKNDIIHKLVKTLAFFICICIVYGFCHNNHYNAQEGHMYWSVPDSSGSFIFKGEKKDTSYHPYSHISNEENLLPDAESAYKAALAIAQIVYGEQIKEELPFSIELVNDSIWQITSSGVCQGKNPAYGGSMFMTLKKRNAEVLYMIHTE